jgi:uncharacterized tellurite resistance protein B-like protein
LLGFEELARKSLRDGNDGLVMVSIFLKLINSKSSFNISDADPGNRVQVATCAILMAVASADEFTVEESKRIIQILQKEFNLTVEDAEALIEVAGREFDRSIDYWTFTSTLNESLSETERIGIMENVWRVVYTDGQLSAHEDTLVHKLSFLLNLRHDQMIAAKLKIRGEQGLN